jgi:hypothetical protein
MKHNYTIQEQGRMLKKGTITFLLSFFIALISFGQSATTGMSQVQQGVCPASNELNFELPWTENFGLGGALSWTITKDGESEPEYTGQYGYYTYSVPDYQEDFFQAYCLEGGCYTVVFTEAGFGDEISAGEPLTITNGNGTNLVEPLTGDIDGFSFQFCTGNPGCIDETACNYDEEASIDDESCEYLTCSCGTAVYNMAVEQDCIDLEAASFLDSDFGCSFPADFNIAWNGNTNTGYLIPSSGATAAYVDLTFCDITYEDATAASYVSGYGLSGEYGLTPSNTFIVHTQEGNYYAIGDIQVVDIQPTEISIDFASRLIESTPGCMDESACNFNPEATIDDESCTYSEGEFSFDCPEDVELPIEVGQSSVVYTYELPVLSGSCEELNFGMNNLDAFFAQNVSNYLDLLGNTYNFGYDGNDEINDGGNDMYDGGNQLWTNLSDYRLAYTDGMVSLSDDFGPNGRYVTSEQTGMFLLAAELNGIEFFETTGNLGADGSGSTSTMELSSGNFDGFYKQVCSAGDPSINQLMIVDASVGASQTASNDTNDGEHTVSGLSTASRMVYLMWAGNSGYCYSEEEVQGLLDEATHLMDLIADGNVELTSGLYPGGSFLAGTTLVEYVFTDEAEVDHTCSFEVNVVAPNPGCTDESACNFDPEAETLDDSCEYEEMGFDCDGECLGDEITSEDLVNQAYWSVSIFDCSTGEGESIGEAVTFNIDGTLDLFLIDEFGNITPNLEAPTDMEYELIGNCALMIDGLPALFIDGMLVAEGKGCVGFSPVSGGCTDEAACNFDPEALLSDNSLCDYDCYGCTDENADNFDFFATLDDGSCLYNDFCISAEPLLLDDDASIGDNTYAGGSLNEADCFDDDDVVNSVWFSLEVPEGAFQIRTILDGTMDDSMMEIYESCAATESIACNDDDEDLESQIGFNCGELIPGSIIYIRVDGYDESIGTFSILAESVEEVVEGCMDETAANYNACANIEDDSCEFEGCTDETAANYDENATIDDGSCTFEGCTDEAAANYNENASIDDGSCEYEGCTDETALNFDENATIDDGSCEYNCFEPTVLYDLTGCNDDEDGFSINLNVLNTGVSGPFIISNNINGDELLVSEDGDYTYGDFDEDEDVVIILTSTITPDCFVSSGILACPLSLNEQEEELVWNLYPNPASTVLNVSLDATSIEVVNIYDARGRLVESHQVNQNLMSINTSNWASGMYHVQVLGNDFVATKTVIVQP